MPLTICLHCSTPTTDHDAPCPVCQHYPGQLDCECPRCACDGDEAPAYSTEWEMAVA